MAYRGGMKVCCPSSCDVFENLALEDVLLDRAAEFAPLLLIYVNDPCVVIGKNQVPWRECATGRLRDDGVPVARRISGGGTVFHDAGNLNYSFILPRDGYRQENFFKIILAALAELEIRAAVGPHNGLFSGERKFSGTAFCYRRQHVLHHGTLLVNADLDRLRRYCTPALPQIATKAIASRPASVVNLRELRSDLTIEMLADAIIREAEATVALKIDRSIVKPRADELRAWDFVWGHTPRFDVEIGGCRMQVDRGVIAQSDIAGLVGARFDRESLLRGKSPMIGDNAAAFFQALEKLDF